MKTIERLWILCRSEQVSNARWRSWENSVSVNRATVRRRERCGQHDGVTDGKVTQCAVDLWCDSSENRSQCTRGYTRTSCSEDPADAPSSLLALCRDDRLQCGVHARTNDRRSVCGTSKWRQTCQEERYGDCEEPSKVCDARRQLSKHTWVTYWKMLGSGGARRHRPSTTEWTTV